MMRIRKNGGLVLRHPEAGFSLIEVMAALVILAIAMTAVFATFISQQKSFTTQNRVAEMQQNLRQAAEVMSRDIRMAGYGIPDNVAIPNNVIASGVTSLRSLYPKDNSTGPDQIYLLYMFDMDNNQRSTWNTAEMASGAASVTVDNAAGFLSSGELVIVTDYTKAQLFQVSSKTATSLTFGGAIYPGTSSSAFVAGSPPPAPSTVAKARFNRYFIDSTTDPAHPTLMVDRMGGATPQPVADDIEDMQFTYGLDTNGDGIIESWSSGAATPSQIRQVRLQLMARTRLPEAGWSELRPVLGNHPAATTPDGYRRRTYDIVIDVRNSGV
ncbi:MAG: prepilin-type N-terminal cleavage/methylation domain-containing protein [Deltaproteobacteria bacterium]|nr:MAG: prepilin-type N-terminal cleavage/methylation domain-containing protein [Deltaproteobacteria bacterium]